MEKFLSRNTIAGYSEILGIKKVQLILPNAKHYALHAVKNGEDVLREETLLEDACSRKTSEAYHISPYVFSQMVERRVPRARINKQLQKVDFLLSLREVDFNLEVNAV